MANAILGRFRRGAYAGVRHSPTTRPIRARLDWRAINIGWGINVKSKLAMLLMGVLMSATGEMAQAITAGANPDKAPVAMVDRFSKEAGHLQVRTATNGIPGPNEPVDFDTGPFVTQGLSPAGKPVRYYNFDVQGTTPAPVYVLYRTGEDHPVAGQLPVIDTLPGEPGYNDFRQVWKVTVAADYVPNSVTDASQLRKSGYRMEKTDVLRNMPVVPNKSVARSRLNGATAELQRAWYQGKVAKFFAFDEARLLAANSEAVPVSAISVFFNVNPDQPNGGPGSGFRTEPGSHQTHNVVSTLPGDTSYSPLWLVSVFDTKDWPMVHDVDSVSQANVIGVGVATVNCPIFFVTR